MAFDLTDKFLAQLCLSSFFLIYIFSISWKLAICSLFILLLNTATQKLYYNYLNQFKKRLFDSKNDHTNFFTTSFSQFESILCYNLVGTYYQKYRILIANYWSIKKSNYWKISICKTLVENFLIGIVIILIFFGSSLVFGGTSKIDDQELTFRELLLVLGATVICYYNLMACFSHFVREPIAENLALKKEEPTAIFSRAHVYLQIFRFYYSKKQTVNLKPNDNTQSKKKVI